MMDIGKKMDILTTQSSSNAQEIGNVKQILDKIIHNTGKFPA